MNTRLKKLIILVVVISTILTVGGIVYTSMLGVENNKYTTTMGTIAEIETETVGENTVVVKWASVTYKTPQGEMTSKLSGMLPNRLEKGAEVEVRFNNENPYKVTAETINWFPAVMLIVLGVLYAVAGAMVIVFKKKAGYYAIVEQTNDPTPIEDDGFSIADQIEKMDQEENMSDFSKDAISGDNDQQ